MNMSTFKILKPTNNQNMSRSLYASWADLVTGNANNENLNMTSEEIDEEKRIVLDILPDRISEESHGSQEHTTDSVKSQAVEPMVDEKNEIPHEHEESEPTILIVPIQENNNYALTPYDLIWHMDEFDTGSNQVQIADDSYIPVTFRGKRCIFETPACFTVFGIKGYKNPGSRTQKFSIHLSLGADGTEEMEQFKTLLFKMDDWAMQTYKEKYNCQLEDVYWSPVRRSLKKKKKPPVLRVKVPCTGKNAGIDLYTANGTRIREPSLEVMRKHIPHHTSAKCILAINPIWKANHKYGISYRLLKIKVQQEAEDVVFR